MVDNKTQLHTGSSTSNPTHEQTISHSTSVSSSSTFSCFTCIEFRWCCLRGSNASTTICSVPLISALQNGQPCNKLRKKIKINSPTYLGFIFSILTCPSESTCHAFKQGVHNKCPHGSIRMSLSFSAQILHNWNVLPGKKTKLLLELILKIEKSSPSPSLTHFTIKFILFLCHRNVILHRALYSKRQVRIGRSSVGI